MDRPAGADRPGCRRRFRACLPRAGGLVTPAGQQGGPYHVGRRVGVVSRHAVGASGLLVPRAARAVADLVPGRQALVAPSAGGVAAAYVYAAADVVAASNYATIVFALGLVALPARRYVEATGPERRGRLASLTAAAAFGLVLVAGPSPASPGPTAIMRCWPGMTSPSASSRSAWLPTCSGGAGRRGR